VGLFYGWGKRVAAVFELIIVLTAIYAMLAMATKGISQRYILPGFGNAPIDPLLIRRNVKRSNKKEKRKNAKYAEPMGMGYMGNVIPASVICFLGLGYFQDMTIPIIAVGCNSLLHILASYYSFLRGDFFNSIQFTVYFIFWTSKCSFFYILPVDEISSIDSYYGSWGTILALAFITVCSSTQPMVVLVYNGLLTLTAILSVEHIPISVQSYTFGVSAVLSWIMTVYISTAHLLNSCAEKPVLYIGSELVSEDRLFCCCKRAMKR
jgi:succinate-acetate transporter protein